MEAEKMEFVEADVMRHPRRRPCRSAKAEGWSDRQNSRLIRNCPELMAKEHPAARVIKRGIRGPYHFHCLLQ